MQSILLIIALIILLCIVANRFSNKFGMPVLLLFMLLGIAFGVDGFFGFEFDNYVVINRVGKLKAFCSNTKKFSK